MIVGLALALASALATNVAFLFKHRGAVLAPPVRARHPLRSAVDLFRSTWFAVGSARGLQIGPGVEVIALTSVAANLTAIIGGILVFRDSIGSGALEISGRMLAFCLVVAGAALIPAPVRAAGAPSGASGRPESAAAVTNP